MTTLFTPDLPSTTYSSMADAADFEPDEEWKEQLEARVQLWTQSLAKDAKDSQLVEFRKAVTPEDRKRVDFEYKASMARISQLAKDQYHFELEKERNQRQWSAGEPTMPAWSTYLMAEQEHIMNTIKQYSDQPTFLASTERRRNHVSPQSPIELRGSPTSCPNPIYNSPKTDAADLEPTDEWKSQLKARIHLGLQSRVQDAKDSLFVEIRKSVVTPEVRKRLGIEYNATIASIKQLADNQYQAELEEERQRRRQTPEEPTLSGWSTYMKAEQEHTMNTKQSGHPSTPDPDGHTKELRQRLRFILAPSSRTGVESSRSSSTKSISSTLAVPSWTPNPAQDPKSAMDIPPQEKSCTGSIDPGTLPVGASPHSTPGTDEWHRRQTEFTNALQEKCRHEQEKIEDDMQMRSAGKSLSREDLQRVFKMHERLWTQLPQKSSLTWHDFPWPIKQNGKVPASPADISYSLVTAYMYSTGWSDADKSKDRITENMRRWHRDRFDAKFLPKVVESERDDVKQGAKDMARYLNALLRKENTDGEGPKILGEYTPSITALANQHTTRALDVAKEEERENLKMRSNTGMSSDLHEATVNEPAEPTEGGAQERPKSGTSKTIVPAQPTDANYAMVHVTQQRAQSPVVMPKTEEYIFAKATVVRYRTPHSVVSWPARLRRTSGPTVLSHDCIVPRKTVQQLHHHHSNADDCIGGRAREGEGRQREGED